MIIQNHPENDPDISVSLIQKEVQPRSFNSKFYDKNILISCNKPYHYRQAIYHLHTIPKNILTLIELLMYTTINYIYLKTKRDNYFMKFVIPLMKSLFKSINEFYFIFVNNLM